MWLFVKKGLISHFCVVPHLVKIWKSWMKKDHYLTLFQGLGLVKFAKLWRKTSIFDRFLGSRLSKILKTLIEKRPLFDTFSGPRLRENFKNVEAKKPSILHILSSKAWESEIEMEVLYTTKVEPSSTFWAVFNSKALWGVKFNGGVIYYQSGSLVNFLAPFNSKALWEWNWMDVSIYYQSGILVNFLALFNSRALWEGNWM